MYFFNWLNFQDGDIGCEASFVVWGEGYEETTCDSVRYDGGPYVF